MVTWEIDPVGKDAALQTVMELLVIVTGPCEMSHEAVDIAGDSQFSVNY
jgi:hypothetical protein